MGVVGRADQYGVDVLTLQGGFECTKYLGIKLERLVDDAGFGDIRVDDDNSFGYVGILRKIRAEANRTLPHAHNCHFDWCHADSLNNKSLHGHRSGTVYVNWPCL